MQTVKDDCKHEDCKYRGNMNRIPTCQYMLVTGRPRMCDIADCNRYEAGKAEIVSKLEGVHFKGDDVL